MITFMKTTFYKGNDHLLVFVGDENIDKIRENLNCSVLFVSDFDWNDALTPWPAEKVFRNSKDFGGHADTLLKEIESLDIWNKSWERCTIAGYSLAGLFALDACSKSDLFDGCISCSGSLWYDRFLEYIEKNPVRCKYVYLSLGDKEKNSSNPRMAKVETCHRKMIEILSKYTDCIFELNHGNHFQDPEGRIRKGIIWMEKEYEKVSGI